MKFIKCIQAQIEFFTYVTIYTNIIVLYLYINSRRKKSYKSTYDKRTVISHYKLLVLDM